MGTGSRQKSLRLPSESQEKPFVGTCLKDAVFHRAEVKGDDKLNGDEQKNISVLASVISVRLL